MKRFLAVLLVAVMLLSVLPATSMAASYATVVGGWLRLRSAPNFSASTITSYYTGTQVEILGSSGGWYKVQTPDGRTGYMYGNYLRMGGSVPSAVSYTHLDVYKRQVVGFEPTTSRATIWRSTAELYPPRLARLKGFEPLTHGLEGRCSIQLSYRRKPHIRALSLIHI